MGHQYRSDIIGWSRHQYRSDIIHAETGLTWKRVADITDANAPFRQYKELLEKFELVILTTEEGKKKGWPFGRVGNSNDKDIVFNPEVSDAVRQHVLTHPSSKAGTPK